MLTIDYGDTSPALYHRRPHGTLRGYFMQHRVEGPALYQNIGRQDLTADINFTDYRAWLHGSGLEEAACQTLAEFLRSHNAPAQLLDPDGAGNAFKCLAHRRR
jgi:SAM-dependent MidA family methyltransferase